MLSLGKLAHGQQEYYLDTVAKGAEEYYTGGKEAPGEWQGGAAARLGLFGEFDADALSDVLGHRDPASGEPLSSGRSHPHVAGFDATFSAPKSVSLLFALGRPEVSNEVRNAHDAAVRDALAVLEGEASVGRRGRGGAATVSGDGFVAAAFRHRTSRAAEPQLHTHVVIANLVHSVDDERWTALDARPLYRWARPVGHLYEAQLRWELTNRLGVAWRPVRNGIADVAGIPQPAIDAFSTRRRQIAQHLDAHGESSARAAQVAAYATRSTKDADATPETLVDGWCSRAAAHGLDDRSLARVLERQPATEPPAPGSAEAEALFCRLASPVGLTAHRSNFGRGDVLEAICNA
ncbi:MAG: relaxase domain-containing protein, partial [Actinomycetota bacterium]|nr:relaxase domain-containing protein [Actinomycetota bacterium]